MLQGYKEEIEKPENQHLLPAALIGQADVLFGNLHELFTFHQDIFLKDLEKSISATELVALCFVDKVIFLFAFTSTAFKSLVPNIGLPFEIGIRPTIRRW